MRQDRFGNEFAPGLPYARGHILTETLQRFGGSQAYARAINACLNTLAGMLTEPEQIRRLLLGDT
jgi:hypothetical protein